MKRIAICICGQTLERRELPVARWVHPDGFTSFLLQGSKAHHATPKTWWNRWDVPAMRKLISLAEITKWIKVK